MKQVHALKAKEHRLDRRQVLTMAGSLALPFPSVVGHVHASGPSRDYAYEFRPETVRDLARAVAGKTFEPASGALSSAFKSLTYDQYRTIRFRPDRSLWQEQRLPFQVQFFHRGFIFAGSVQVYEVSDGQARRLSYAPDLFDLSRVPQPSVADMGFAGFRVHTRLNRPDYFDEVAVFLGASYFRAVAKNQTYGLSARGLALGTGDPKGEEFPVFRSFWIERPPPNARELTLHALLDSRSAVGAYRFKISPGDTTIFDVDATICPRIDLNNVGVAPLTSMFFFDANDRVGVDDFRPAVHDSDGLAVRNGRSEEIWRPLSNPQELQVSVFTDANPRGFGLLQRERNFSAYQDIESQFENRPSCWVEPLSEFGEGAVQLVEIPTKEEIHDNIAAFWRPHTSLKAREEHLFAYRLHWANDKPNKPSALEILKTRVGSISTDKRLFVLDLQGDERLIERAEALTPRVSSSRGRISNVVLQRNRRGGARLAFELAPEKATLVELRAQIEDGDRIVSEVWLYRWTPG